MKDKEYHSYIYCKDSLYYKGEMITKTTHYDIWNIHKSVYCLVTMGNDNTAI